MNGSQFPCPLCMAKIAVYPQNVPHVRCPGCGYAVVVPRTQRQRPPARKTHLAHYFLLAGQSAA